MEAKIRLNAMTSTEHKVEWSEGDSLLEIFDRACKEHTVPDEVRQYLHILVEGHIVEPDYWNTRPSKAANITIAVIPEGGSGRGIFKQVAVLAVIVAVTYATGGTATPLLSASMAAFAGAAAGIATTLALNSLMPEPLPGLSGLGSDALSGSIESSQMYTVSSQSNKVAKYSGVPKVYGTFRLYPYVAANPYTELAPDVSTGELAQYLVAIYDFGHGPMSIRDLKIGETSITDFSDIEYRFIDPNRPTYAEGDTVPEWDSNLYDAFNIYSGDGETTSVSYSLTANKSDSGASEEDYQVVRNTAGTADGSGQTVAVNLVCPTGLDAIDTAGTHHVNRIEIDLEFAEVGTDDWNSYSDEAVVNSFEVIGATDNTLSGVKSMAPATIVGSGENFYFEHYTTRKTAITYRNVYGRVDSGVRTETFYWQYTITATIPAGTTEIIAQSGISALGIVKINGISVGAIASETAIGNGYSTYELVDPVATTIDLYYSTVDKSLYKYWRNSTIWRHDWAPSGENTTASISYQYRNGSIVTLSGSTTDPVYCQIKFSPKKSTEYKVRVIRNRTYSSASYVTYDDLTWTTLDARYERNAINTTKRHTFLELRIRATNQLSGTIQNLSGVVTSVLNVYDEDTASWSLQETNNPAWVFCDLMSGQINKRAIDRSRIELSSILEWAAYCDEVPPVHPEFEDELPTPRYRTNFLLDYTVTLQEVLNQVSNACQASLAMADGKYGVLVDKKREIPVQVFTERNSWGFSSARTYMDPPDELRLKYTDVDTWQLDEVSVYRDGYDANNSETFEEMSTFACTDMMQAWRFGRFAIAQAELRKETISIQVDFEHLVCTRGDYVIITQDVMKVGGMPARVVYVDGANIRIDAKFSPETGKEYGYTYRPVNGNITTSTMTITSPNTATLDGPSPSAGDLIIWGEVGHISFDCLVKAITPSDNLTATLTLVEKADAIHDADTVGPLPSYLPNLNTTATEGTAPTKVGELSIADNSYNCTGYAYEYYIDLSWIAPADSVYASFEIYVDSGTGFSLLDTVTKVGYRYIVTTDHLDIEHKFKVIAVSATGQKLGLADVDEVEATPTTKVAPPSDVEGLYLNVTNETVQIDWPAVRECDIAEYLIRYSPQLSSTWEVSVHLQRVDAKTTMTTVQARTGTYLIKAVDFNGNESDVAAWSNTSIPDLVNLNVIEETNDFPDLEGEIIQVVKDGETLILQEESLGNYFTEGTYYFDKFLDVGDIYTVRLQSHIEAEGFTKEDVMGNWVTLDAVLAMSNSRFSDWDVETWYRATEKFNVMSEWPSMDAIDPISEGFQDNWTPWRKFTMGDFSGRIFQFKLVLKSYKAGVTPRVFNGIIKADMPDRRDIYNDLISSTVGTNIIYKHPFKGPGTSPVVMVTQDNAQTGDTFTVTNKTLVGCTITFYDKDDIAVERQFDLSAEGYGRKTDTVL